MSSNPVPVAVPENLPIDSSANAPKVSTEKTPKFIIKVLGQIPT